MAMRNTNIRSYFFALAIIALLTWLGFSSRPGRISEINHALENHTLNSLPDSVLVNLYGLVKDIFAAAHISEPISIDRPLSSKSRLRFFVCNDAYTKLTHCVKGNALYDAELNAIFIDQSLVKPDEWNHYVPAGRFSMGVTAADLPFLRTYLEFIIAHELGHFAMHKKTLGYFDIGGNKNNGLARSYEIQADSFAIRTLVSAIAEDSSGSFLAKRIGETMDIDIDSVRAASDKAILAVTDIARNVPVALLLGPEGFSPYQHDVAHPAFFQRSQNALNAILKLPYKDGKIHSLALYYQRCMSAVEEIASKHSFTEVNIPEQIVDANFDDTGLIIQSFDTVGNLYAARYAAITPQPSPGEVLKAPAKNLNFQKFISDYDFATNSLYAFTDGPTIFVTKSGALCVRDRNSWKMADTATFKKLFADNVPLQSSPAGSVIVFMDYSNDFILGKDLSLVKADPNAIKSRVFSALDRQDEDAEMLWDQALLASHYCYVTVKGKKKNSSLLALARLKLPGLGVDSIFRINCMTPELRVLDTAFDEEKTRILMDETNSRLFILSSQLSLNERKAFCLYEILKNGTPKLVAERRFLCDSLLTDMEPSIEKNCLFKTAGNSYFVNWDNDAIYRIDLTAGTIEPYFYPGTSTMNMRMSKNGYVAFFNPWLNKVYVSKDLPPAKTQGGALRIFYWIGALIFLVSSSLIARKALKNLSAKAAVSQK